MKIRSGFVSNSSSSSFVVSLRKLSPEQLGKILNHTEWGEKLGVEYSDSREAWDITVEKGVLHGNTSMDNFDMRKFLEKLGVTGVIWSEYQGIEDDTMPDDCMDEACDDCNMRFICYTNKWVKNEN